MSSSLKATSTIEYPWPNRSERELLGKKTFTTINTVFNSLSFSKVQIVIFWHGLLWGLEQCWRIPEDLWLSQGPYYRWQDAGLEPMAWRETDGSFFLEITHQHYQPFVSVHSEVAGVIWCVIFPYWRLTRAESVLQRYLLGYQDHLNSRLQYTSSTGGLRHWVYYIFLYELTRHTLGSNLKPAESLNNPRIINSLPRNKPFLISRSMGHPPWLRRHPAQNGDKNTSLWPYMTLLFGWR